ncbi:hypothetical protein QBC38DRAFT_512318 [Podospora fimiseda]|uniref:mevalonate kinase n=1 Tax=Podospora fimiseda TaxID=252190 RepID=A0AAN7BHV7_9PEZI|nr:hypothetical protein QBC38DRAFT_512318 [Podospora fimiseda]
MTQRTVTNGHNGVHLDVDLSDSPGTSSGNSSDSGLVEITNGVSSAKLNVRKNIKRKQSSPMMPSFMVSAPGKVIVYGEHAVVHGKAAIAAAISLRSYLLVTSLSKSRRTVTLTFPDIDFDHTWNIDDLPWELFQQPPKKKYYYSLVTELDPELVAAVQPYLADVSLHKPAEIRKIHQNSAGSFLYMFLSLGSQSFPGSRYTLRSTIPIGAGLGSSATIAVCMSAALLLQLRTLSGPHPDQPPDEARLQIERINRWALVYEMFIHGNPSGVDNTVASQGKAVLFQRTDYSKPPMVTPLWDFPELPLLLVDTRTPKSTAHEVAKVGRLKDAHPKLVGSILDAIDKVTDSAAEVIKQPGFDTKDEESLRQVGELMTINHGLLVSLGVSHPRLERVRELVDHEGIGWTKLTGAGGGGCSITLLKPGVPREKLDRLEEQLDQEGYQKFETTLGGDGVGVLWPAVLKNGTAEDDEGGMEIDLDKFLSAEAAAAATILEQSRIRTDLTNPFALTTTTTTTKSISTLSKQDQLAWFSASLISRYSSSPQQKTASYNRLFGPKPLKDLWKPVCEFSLPLKRIRKPRRFFGGIDGRGKEVSGYTLEEFEARKEKQIRLGCLDLLSRGFKDLRGKERRGVEGVFVTESEIEAEKQRRKEMAGLKSQLYGGPFGIGETRKMALDPEWDDVQPVWVEEVEGALASIAYSRDYAEAMAYLRAVMQAKEYSERCIRLTEHIIRLNPSHYTVWLYRAANLFALNLSILDEFEWLNAVALENLKNYQIWHHRHLLVEHYYPTIEGDTEAIEKFAAKEREFLKTILDEDTKNYHVWSYRSYLVGKLKQWGNGEELKAIEGMIDDDVRNNSAWSHRFFLVFSNPDHATVGLAASEVDTKLPAELVDREVEYAQEKILLAPQNQSGWNYLKGVLVKGGRKLGSVEGFVKQFVDGLVSGEDSEVVKSTHALDLLAEIYAERGDKENADLCLTRLAEKWDRIRNGYWQWRRQALHEVVSAAA